MSYTVCIFPAELIVIEYGIKYRSIMKFSDSHFDPKLFLTMFSLYIKFKSKLLRLYDTACCKDETRGRRYTLLYSNLASSAVAAIAFRHKIIECD
jgi:hypothetical protein